MKRPALLMGFGLVVGALAFGLLYATRTAECRDLARKCGPELAWIKKEFHLGDADFENVRRLHAAYKPVCADMCRRIDLKHAELAQLLDSAQGVTSQIEQILKDAALLRTECQTEMLRHFFQVSRAMPPEQGRRYLAWMHAQTLAPAHEAMVPKVGVAPTGHEHHQ